MNYYNEFDPFAAAWLKELSWAGLIAPGIVDTRSIEDVTPNDLRGFTQCHFFAGIGVWSYALRRAGWPDTRPVWTGSCPCQPLSQAGKGLGFADERHLWPSWHHLIRECRPAVIYGEQVASKASGVWTDLVQDDMEALDYAFGAVPFPAASVGAPHIRDRQYWMAHDHRSASRQGRALARGSDQGGDALARPGLGGSIGTGRERLADDDDAGRVEHPQRDGESVGECEEGAPGSDTGRRDQLGDTKHPGLEGHAGDGDGARGRQVEARSTSTASATSFWSECGWVWCRDGKWRPIESGSFPLVNGAPARVGRLRGYGNAIVAQAAQIFIEESGLI